LIVLFQSLELMRVIFLFVGLLSVTFNPDSSILLNNPSFEGVPEDARVPDGWHACGSYSTPDILPGPWGVYQEAYHGDTFLGLISREDGTWEHIGQQLPQALKKDECYTFSVKLARSSGYVGYNKALKFRIWGGTKKCGKAQLLGHTVAISHTDWKSYRFNFFTNDAYSHIIIEAYYVGKTPYRGNLLIDACSPFEVCMRASLD
jgi:hypothetical protein